jgi:hypothetical protein
LSSAARASLAEHIKTGTMFNISALAANVLNSLDNAAKDTLEEPRVSATALRNQRLNATRDEKHEQSDDDEIVEESVPERAREVLATRVLHAHQYSCFLPLYMNLACGSTKNTTTAETYQQRECDASPIDGTKNAGNIQYSSARFGR